MMQIKITINESFLGLMTVTRMTDHSRLDKNLYRFEYYEPDCEEIKYGEVTHIPHKGASVLVAKVFKELTTKHRKEQVK